MHGVQRLLFVACVAVVGSLCYLLCGCLLSNANCSLFDGCCLMFVVWCGLVLACCVLFGVCCLYVMVVGCCLFDVRC